MCITLCIRYRKCSKGLSRFIKKGGKGFASLNLIRLYENDNSTSLTKQLDKLKIIEDIIEEVIVVEEPHASGLDGNLHIIFKSP